MPDRAETLRKLKVVRIVCLVDFALLVVLVICSRWVADVDAGVAVLGPLHGIVVIGLLYLTVVGVGESRWRWWFPVSTLIPPVALVLEERMRRQLRGT